MKTHTIRMISAVIAFACLPIAYTMDLPAWSMGARPPAAGMTAADFSLPDLEGRMRSLNQYRGKIVLINFWATWCKPCMTEMPAMQAVYDRLRDKDFVVLAVDELEDEAKVREHIRTYGHTFPVLLDRDNKVANQYGVYGLPVSVFIDETGLVQEYIKGGLLTEPKIYEVLDRIRANAQLKVTAH
ncbi:MAG TPA: TlpA disulfide reductase family protein [Nitrospiraceae bacterium]|nr:TlpA disulfide reductase family protein [Nitrospiraceae bacterium]